MSRAEHKRIKHLEESEEKKEGGETSRVILQTAQQLFATYGYRAVTTRQIAKACGITQPALYRHFSTKQDIYITMILATNAQVKAALERIAQRNIHIDEQLRLAALYLLNHTRQDISMMVHDIQHELTEEARTMLENAFIEGTVQALAAIFEAGIQQGFLRSPQEGGFSSSAAAFMFLNLISHFVSNSFESHLRKDEQAAFLVQFCLYGMASPNQQAREM